MMNKFVSKALRHQSLRASFARSSLSTVGKYATLFVSLFSLPRCVKGACVWFGIMSAGRQFFVWHKTRTAFVYSKYLPIYYQQVPPQDFSLLKPPCLTSLAKRWNTTLSSLVPAQQVHSFHTYARA